MMWLYTFLSIFIISLLSLVGLTSLLLKERLLNKVVFFLVSLSVGALFGDALIHLIPEALQSGKLSGLTFASFVFAGFLVFFVLEKFLRWRHSHGIDEECAETILAHDHNKKSIGPMILVADAIHNMIDGIVVAASYLVSFEIGLATTIAVILHEIPQEIGDFGLLIHSGFTRSRALIWNFISALFALFGAVVVLIIGNSVENLIPVAISIAAGGFIYIAGSDIVPELHQTKNIKHSLVQILAILIGFGMMSLLLLLEK